MTSACSSIIEGKVSEEKQVQYEQIVMLHARSIYESLGNRRTNAPITKDEFVQYVKDTYFSQGIVYINDVFQALITPPGSNDGDEDGNSKGSPPRK